MKVLYHVDERERWGMLLGNVANMLAYAKEQGTPFAIEVVANGPAVQDLVAQQSALEDRLAQICAQARICACNNALGMFGIAPETLYSFVRVVPAGVVEIAARQQEGYAYIKP
nr:DsrE family protein [Maliibacterium massiliense]